MPPKKTIATPKTKKTPIPKAIRTQVWKNTIGNSLDGKCYVCDRDVSYDNFDAGHIIPEAKGGDISVDNLRVVCKPCNTSCGTKNLNDFKKAFKKNNKDVKEAKEVKEEKKDTKEIKEEKKQKALAKKRLKEIREKSVGLYQAICDDGSDVVKIFSSEQNENNAEFFNTYTEKISKDNKLYNKWKDLLQDGEGYKVVMDRLSNGMRLHTEYEKEHADADDYWQATCSKVQADFNASIAQLKLKQADRKMGK